jgi:hypothetical protein
MRRNESSYEETLGIRNKDSSKCSKRCRQARAAFESKESEKQKAIHT